MTNTLKSLIPAIATASIGATAFADELTTAHPVYDAVSCIPWQGAFSCEIDTRTEDLDYCRKIRDQLNEQLQKIANYHGRAYAVCTKEPTQSMEIVK